MVKRLNKILFSPLKCDGVAHVTPSQIKSTNFEFMITTDTNKTIINKNLPIPFENIIYDKTFGSIKNGVFFAPVDGLFRFEFPVGVFF